MKTKELVNKILVDKPNNEAEWLELESKVKDFMASEASDEDKKELSKYTEMLLMVCNGIRKKK